MSSNEPPSIVLGTQEEALRVLTVLIENRVPIFIMLNPHVLEDKVWRGPNLTHGEGGPRMLAFDEETYRLASEAGPLHVDKKGLHITLCFGEDGDIFDVCIPPEAILQVTVVFGVPAQKDSVQTVPTLQSNRE